MLCKQMSDGCVKRMEVVDLRGSLWDDARSDRKVESKIEQAQIE